MYTGMPLLITAIGLFCHCSWNFSYFVSLLYSTWGYPFWSLWPQSLSRFPGVPCRPHDWFLWSYTSIMFSLFPICPPDGYNINKAQENRQPQDGRVQISRSTHGGKPSSIRNPSLNSYISKKYIFIMLSHYNFRSYCSN